MELNKKQIETIKEELSTVDVEAIYDDMLDDVHGVTEIAGLNYQTSRVLAEIDPVAYRCGLADYIDALMEDGQIVEVEGDFYDLNEVETLIDSMDEVAL